MTPVVRLILCALLLLGGAALVFVGWRSLRGRLPRNNYVGVRTPATMRNGDAFELGNRVAAPATLGSGAVLLLSGTSLPMLTTTLSAAMVLGIGFVGALALAIVGGVLGHRAAATVPATGTASGAVSANPCAGCAGGCCGSLQGG
ncbi:SdpI family protein [Halopolyspora algeriensis]|uniref:SdpI family protein n=1 Tax=Halopolyspora algeriensis TaxID=1500506 RepID=UPI000DF4264A|nr:SdpI family protein [Halopolyspora algeriensis]